MLTIRTLCLGASLVATGAAVSSCLSPPEYPVTPEITFKSIEPNRVATITGTYDTVTVTVSFRDGDGDLGLNNDETDPPFNSTNADGTSNLYYNNYFFQPQILKDGEFIDYKLAFSYDSRFPRLPPDDRDGPKRGTLSFGQRFFLGTFPSGSQVRFKVKIVDRALHESNEITTEPITIK